MKGQGLNHMLGALGALAVTAATTEGGGWVRGEPRRVRASLRRLRAERKRQRRFRKKFHRAHMKR